MPASTPGPAHTPAGRFVELDGALSDGLPWRPLVFADFPQLVWRCGMKRLSSSSFWLTTLLFALLGAWFWSCVLVPLLFRE